MAGRGPGQGACAALNKDALTGMHGASSRLEVRPGPAPVPRSHFSAGLKASRHKSPASRVNNGDARDHRVGQDRLRWPSSA